MEPGIIGNEKLTMFIIVGNDHSCNKDAQDLQRRGEGKPCDRKATAAHVEDQNSIKYTLNSSGNIPPRVLGLGRGTVMNQMIS